MKYIKLIWISIAFAVVFPNAFIHAEHTIGKIFINVHPVFEKTDKDWFFASPFLNSLHSQTKKYIIEDELLFQTGDTISEDIFLETERNLRSAGLFNGVKIELEKTGDNEYDAHITTKDRWSLYPAILIGVSANDWRYGAKLQEYNLFGTGTHISAEALYRQEMDIGWQGTFLVENRRLFRSDIGIYFYLQTQQHQTNQELTLEKKFLTQSTKTIYGISGENNFGKDFLINKTALQERYYYDTLALQYLDTAQYVPVDEQRFDGWIGHAWKWDDKVYMTGWGEYYVVDRGNPIFDCAYDNQGKILFGFSSVAQNFYTINGVNAYYEEDLVIGGWGSATLGRTFPIADYGGEDGLFYTAAQLEKSYYTKNLYLFGQLTAGSSFGNGYAKYTYQEFLGLGFFRFNEKLLIATRFHEQAVWNWPKFRQLSIDDKYGLRGYTMGELAGDNRMVSNIELRYFPDWQISVLKFSGLVFCDIASVWNQSDKLHQAQFYSSVGLGLRLHFTKSEDQLHTWRIDIPYNMHTKKFAISAGVKQYFSVFNNHDYKLPEIYGTEFDTE